MRKAFLFCVAFSLLVYDRGDATINLLVSTYDGFVIGADSRVTLSDKEKHRIASDSYQKIFRIGKFVGVACSGAAFLYDESGDRRNIGSIVDACKIRYNISDSISMSPRAVAESLNVFVGEIYNKQRRNVEQGLLNLLIFGYDEKKDRKIFEVSFPSVEGDSKDNLHVYGVVKAIDTSGTLLSVVEGQKDVYTRLIKGYDPGLLNMACYEKEKDSIDNLRYAIRYDIMSLQDAIDFAIFIVRATIEAQRFNQKAVMAVGGDIDVAIITPEGFRWIQRKKLRGEGKDVDFENAK